MADDLWAVPLEALLTNSAKTRATHYREQAAALRAIASCATTAAMSADLLELAVKYEALADSVSAV